MITNSQGTPHGDYYYRSTIGCDRFACTEWYHTTLRGTYQLGWARPPYKPVGRLALLARRIKNRLHAITH
jgi:hypothetical protein